MPLSHVLRSSFDLQARCYKKILPTSCIEL
jgi:hypothetical protein